MKSKVLLLLLIITLSSKTFSQQNIDISTGIGFSEMLNIGVHYQYNQLRFGVSVGTCTNEDVFSITSDLSFYFGDSSQYSNIKNWILILGYTYFRTEDDFNIVKNKYFKTRIGRDFKFSNHIGFNISAGLEFEYQREEIRKQCQSCPLGGPPETLLSFGTEIYYRF